MQWERIKENMLHHLILIYLSLFGLVLGSFIALASLRIPLGESIILPRSHCRHCGGQLRWFENIPLFGFLFLRGKCRHCQKKISWRYPVIEVGTLVVILLAYFQLQTWPRFFLYLFLFLIPVLLLIIIDWENFLLPDAITLPGIIFGFVAHFTDRKFLLISQHVPSTFSILLESFFGALAGGLTLWILAIVYQKLRGREGMGGGDIKFAMMLGAFFGYQGIFFIFLFSSVLGILIGSLLILLKRRSITAPIPFGSCLGLVSILFLFFGNSMVPQYLRWIRHVLT